MLTTDLRSTSMQLALRTANQLLVDRYGAIAAWDLPLQTVSIVREVGRPGRQTLREVEFAYKAEGGESFTATVTVKKTNGTWQVSSTIRRIVMSKVSTLNDRIESRHNPGQPMGWAEYEAISGASWGTANAVNHVFGAGDFGLTGCEITFEVWLGQKNLSFRAIRHRHLNDQVRELAEWQIKTPAEQAAILALGVWQTESAIYYVDPEQMLGTATVKPDPDSLFTVPEVEYDIANYCGDLLAAMFDADLMGETPNPEVAIATAARSEIFTVSEPNYAQFVEAILQVANQAQVELKGIIWRGEYNPEIDQTDFLITFTSPDWSKVNLTFRWKAAGDKHSRTVTINPSSNKIEDAAEKIVQFFQNNNLESIDYSHLIEE